MSFLWTVYLVLWNETHRYKVQAIIVCLCNFYLQKRRPNVRQMTSLALRNVISLAIARAHQEPLWVQIERRVLVSQALFRLSSFRFPTHAICWWSTFWVMPSPSLERNLRDSTRFPAPEILSLVLSRLISLGLWWVQVSRSKADILLFTEIEAQILAKSHLFSWGAASFLFHE